MRRGAKEEAKKKYADGTKTGKNETNNGRTDGRVAGFVTIIVVGRRRTRKDGRLRGVAGVAAPRERERVGEREKKRRWDGARRT